MPSWSVTISPEWIGTGHLLSQPWIPAEFVANTAALTARLDQRAASPHSLGRLASKRRDFRAYGQLPDADAAFDQLWRLRSELVVADRLLDAGVEVTIGRETPDPECSWTDWTFGVEITTRHPAEIEYTLRSRLSELGQSGAGCIVYLRRTEPLIFTMPPGAMHSAVERVVQAVIAGDQAVVALPEAGFTARIVQGAGILPQAHVATEDMPFPGHSTSYWSTLARQIITSVQEKASKTYTIPSVLALDISRLGWCGKWPIDVSWTKAFDDVLDKDCTWGPLTGVVLFRSWLWDHSDPTTNTLQVVTVRGSDVAYLVAALLSTSPTVTPTGQSGQDTPSR